MPKIRTRFQFEPDGQARAAWLGTRKEPFLCGSIFFPGFYQTTGFISDFSWVIGAIIIEITALFMILQAGITIGGISLIGSILSVILFITFDIIGISFTHSKVSEIQMLLNFLIITDENRRPGIIEQIARLKRSFKKSFGYFSLILSSLLKIVSILLLTVLNPTFYVVLAIFYFLVVYIHIRHTGYWFAEIITNRYFNNDYKEYTSDLTTIPPIPPQNIRHSTRSLRSVFEDEIELNQPIVAGGHNIKLTRSFIRDGRNVYEYALETKGILEDGDFILLTQNQVTYNQKALIAKKCLEHQLTVIHPQ